SSEIKRSGAAALAHYILPSRDSARLMTSRGYSWPIGWGSRMKHVRLLPTLVSGLAGWLTYEHMLRKVDHHDEGKVYNPLLELARGNGFSVFDQFPLPRVPGQKGGPLEVDFVFGSAASREILVLEVKFKKTAKEMAGSISRDAKKIRDIDGPTINAVV